MIVFSNMAARFHRLIKTLVIKVCLVIYKANQSFLLMPGNDFMSVWKMTRPFLKIYWFAVTWVNRHFFINFLLTLYACTKNEKLGTRMKLFFVKITKKG